MMNRDEFLLSKYKENNYDHKETNILLNTPKQISLKEYAQRLTEYNNSMKKSADKKVKFSNVILNHSPKPKIISKNLYYSNQIKNPEFNYFQSPNKNDNRRQFSNNLKPESMNKISYSYTNQNNTNNNFKNSFKISNAFSNNNNNLEKPRQNYSQKIIDNPRKQFDQNLNINKNFPNNDNILKNVINELKAQINSKNIQITNLDNDNKNLKRNGLNSDLLKTKLEEEINKHKIMAQQNMINEGTINRLREEISRINKKNVDFQNQMNELMRKNPGVYHYDYGSEKVMSEKEYKLEKEIENYENKIGLLQKEKDKLFLENYELKKIYKIDLPDLDQTVEEIYQMQYENNLQMADLTIKNLKRKLENSEEQKEILNNELNILRSLDIKDNKELLGNLKRDFKIPD